MEVYDLARWLHIVGATVILGTGAGIAFFMVMAHRTGDARVIAHVASTVVLADFLFTATAVAAQPLTGLWLATLAGWPLTTPWILVSLALYAITGAFWLPVVGMQRAMRDLAREARDHEQPLPPRYYQLYKIWFAFGFPAFAAVLAIFWLMQARPALW